MAIRNGGSRDRRVSRYLIPSTIKTVLESILGAGVKSKTPSDPLGPPRAEHADLGHAVLRYALSAIPWVGGPAVDILNSFFGRSLTRRTEEWQAAVADLLRQFRDRGIDMAVLGQSEEFIDAVAQAAQTFMRSAVRPAST